MLANTRYKQAIATSPESSDNTASALASIIDSGARCTEAGDRGGGFSERDVDGIPGRMRTMRRDVEVAHAERKIDGVDVLERRGQERRVRDRVDQREGGQRAPGGHETGRSRSASFRLPRR